MDKGQRTAVHTAIRNRFSNLNSSTTNDADGQQIIKVSRGESTSRKRPHWPSDRSDYCRFVLFKINTDSHFALSTMAKVLGLNVKLFSIAGTKDRRAITTQLVTAYRVTAEKLSLVNNRLKNLKLGNFLYCDNQLFLGDSGGNRFTIVMRNVQTSRERLVELVDNWAENGFINYYGTQRFGTSTVPTFAIGQAILQRRWTDVISMILRPREDVSGIAAECFRVWEATKDAAQALAVIPPKKRYTSIEGNLLSGLQKYGIDRFNEAFRMVPRNTRTLYVHSFQSFIWNKLVSKRIAIYGKRVLPGDYVNCGNEERIVTAEEADQMDPFLLRLPLPSFDAKFPNEEMSRWFDELLKEHDITREDFQAIEKEYSVQGSFRSVFVKLKDFEYDLFSYNDPSVSLALSDHDILTNVSPPVDIPDGKFLAVVLKFSLPPGSYATMAIRELCRIDTGKQYQRGLNSYSDNDPEQDESKGAAALVDHQ